MIESGTQGGRIFTFYSYKGGVGRSMALANLACLLPKYLSNPSQRVLLMDWDLEAPGLHRFFPAQSELRENQNHPGIIDYFFTLQQKFEKDNSLYEAIMAPDGWNVLDKELPLDSFVIRDVVLGGIDLIKAGRLDAEYADLVGSFNWISFNRQYGEAIDTFKTLLTSKYAYCLVDSRTGFTDISGICTILLPEKLIAVFTPNRQSLSGVLDLSTRATNYRRASSDFRPLSIFPLPSRIENAELALKREWRDQYQKEFEERFRTIYGVEECNLTDYFDEVQLPYVGYYAYGEQLAVLGERSEALSLRRAYEVFFDRLMSLDFAWDTSGLPDKGTLEDQSISIQPAQKKYDLFLSYDHQDLDPVEELARLLRDAGITLYFAHWDLLPGQEWERSFLEAIKSSATIAVCIGPLKSSPWQEQVFALIEGQSRKSSQPVIPVYLPGAKAEDAPVQLRSISAVYFDKRTNEAAGLRRLISGIKGVRPDDVPNLPSEEATGRRRVGRKGIATVEPEQLHFEVVAQAITEGTVVPFLGGGVNLSGRTKGQKWQPDRDLPDFEELSVYLAHSFSYPYDADQDVPRGDLARVAQYVSVTYGLGPLYDRLHELFDRDCQPTPLHKFFASLPSALRQRGYRFPCQLIVTMNYDDLLERAFNEAQEPYDLLHYVAEGELRGKFLHRPPGGNSVEIKRPNEYLGPSLENRTIILKANGVVDRISIEQDSFVITEDNFINYLSRFPGSLDNVPVEIRAKLLRSNYLFLGHSPGYWNLRAFLHLIWREQRLTRKSWAVQSAPDEIDHGTWEARGVTLFKMPLDEYVDKLGERLREQRLPGGLA